MIRLKTLQSVEAKCHKCKSVHVYNVDVGPIKENEVFDEKLKKIGWRKVVDIYGLLKPVIYLCPRCKEEHQKVIKDFFGGNTSIYLRYDDERK